MTRRPPALPCPSEPFGLARLGLPLLLAAALALPAAAADEEKTLAANWTVFLSSGSSIGAVEVHHDQERGRYTLKLPSGGSIQLSESTVKRVSRDTKDRVDKPEPAIAASTGSPKQGPVPGALDTSGVKPPGLRSADAAISPQGENLKDKSKERMRQGRVVAGDRGPGRRPSNEASFTPRPGMMDKMIRRANAAPPARPR